MKVLKNQKEAIKFINLHTWLRRRERSLSIVRVRPVERERDLRRLSRSLSVKESEIMLRQKL